MEGKKCVCMTCDEHCTCDLHKDYEENHCNNGEQPITVCTIKKED